MAQKKAVKVRDLKPNKDAKGGAARQAMSSNRSNQSASRAANRATNSAASRSLQ